MLDHVRAFIMANPLLAASLSSLWGAIVVDLMTFIRSKTPGDFFGQFNPKIAVWRYTQAVVSGFLGNVAFAGVASSAVVVAVYLWRG